MKIKEIRVAVHRLPIYLSRIEAPTEHRRHVFMLAAIALPEIATRLPGPVRN